MTDLTTSNLTGNRGSWVKLRPRLFRSTRDNVLLDDISDHIVAGKITANQDGIANKYTFQCQLSDPSVIDGFRDYLAPFLRIEYADGSVADDGNGLGMQCGLYTTLPPSKTITPMSTVGSFESYDLTYELARRSFSTTKRNLVGTKVVPTVKALLADQGITRVSIPDSGRVLTSELRWKTGATVLTRCNDLLNAIGMYSLMPDRVGLLTSYPYRNLSDANADYLYTGGNDSAVLTPFDVAPDVSNVVNHLVVMKESDTAPLKAVRQNNNPASPTNNRPVPIGIGLVSRFETSLASNLQTQADVDALADRLMQEWGSVFINATFRTFPEPWHGLHELYGLDLTDANGESLPDATGNFLCKGWELGFTREDGTMQHDLYRVQPFVNVV